MYNRRLCVLLILPLLTVACAPSNQTTVTPASDGADADVTPVGATGLPAGYVGRADRETANLAEARYVGHVGAWEVTTGPAHILYSPSDVADGSYTVSTTIEQLQRPRHPEAFGLFVGGRDLDGPNQTYTYFVVRETGEVLARVRTGATVRGVIDWRRAPSVPVADSAGRATYRLAIRSTSDSLHFLVNDVQVGSTQKAGIPTDGIAGLRINHNLRVRVSPVRIARR